MAAVQPKMTASSGRSAGSIRMVSSRFEGMGLVKTARIADLQAALKGPKVFPIAKVRSSGYVIDFMYSYFHVRCERSAGFTPDVQILSHFLPLVCRVFAGAH